MNTNYYNYPLFWVHRNYTDSTLKILISMNENIGIFYYIYHKIWMYLTIKYTC